MSKVLILLANPKGENSYTGQLLDCFLDEYKKHNKDDEIKIKELFELGFEETDKEFLVYRSTGLANQGKEELFAHFNELAEEFLKYDKYVFVYPNWNLFVPPSLVNYILWVFRSKHLKDENGVSKLKNRKSIAVYTSGGYTNTLTNSSFGLQWLKTLLTKYDMGETHYVNAEGLEIEPDSKKNFEKYKKEVIELAKTF